MIHLVWHQDQEEGAMKVTILYDNEALEGFRSGWGFSCLIDQAGDRTLFDTGWDGKLLLSNMEKASIDPKTIDRIVLSHSHWDHMGGIGHLPEGADLYVPASLSSALKGEMAKRWQLHEVRGLEKIGDHLWTTGELGESIKEQSLLVESGSGITVFVGCSHPGVPNILQAARRVGTVHGIIGGMHGFSQYEVLTGLELIIPAHCTVNKRRIAELFPEQTVEAGAGLELDLK